MNGLQSPQLSDPGQLVIASRGLLPPLGSLASPIHRETLAIMHPDGRWVKTQRVHHSSADRVQVVVEHPWRNEHPFAFPVDRHSVQSFQRDGAQHVALRPRLLRAELRRDRAGVHPMMNRVSTRFGTAVLNGTTVQSLVADLRRRGEMTTTGRFLVISGGLKPVSKSHINSVPGRGRKSSGIERYFPAEHGSSSKRCAQGMLARIWPLKDWRVPPSTGTDQRFFAVQIHHGTLTCASTSARPLAESSYVP